MRARTTSTARRVPELLRNRRPCDVDDFVGRHFPAGTSRDVARQLWWLLDEDLGIEVSGLHPDDDLASILADSSSDSLDAVELIMALEEELSPDVRAERPGRLGSFREFVERAAQSQGRGVGSIVLLNTCGPRLPAL